MHKLIAVAAAGLVAVAAHAQSNPPGAAVPPNTPGVATGKSEQAGEARKNTRPQGKVRAPTDDTSKTAEGGAMGTDRATAAGEQRAKTRDQRRPGRKPTTQGGTPE